MTQSWDQGRPGQPAVEVDPHDQNDSDAVEVAVAIAIAEALSHPTDARQLTEHQAELIIESAVGVTLRFYAHRVLQLMVSQWQSTTPPKAAAPNLDRIYAPVQSSVDLAVRRAIDQTGESVRDIIRAAADRAKEAVIVVPADQMAMAAPGGTGTARADTVEQGREDPEAEALNRLRIGMDSVSRVLVTRTREEAKEAYAVAVGALGRVWRTRQDGRVRASHGDLEGDFARMGQPFVTIRNVRLMRPGDPDAPLYESVNCRCRLSYRLPPA